ncbi:hypothetical protein Daus18300_005951 [Diaporthe australafricana]|uniref:Uncharacterized protein n=1 Tax=Diaporthe australafricana TaxID=127596 RepID=A0ABR3WXY8_9PEZI
MASTPERSVSPDSDCSVTEHSDLDGSDVVFVGYSPTFHDSSPCSSRESSPDALEIIHDIDLAQYREESPLPSIETSTASSADQSPNENANSQPTDSSAGSQDDQGNATSTASSAEQSSNENANSQPGNSSGGSQDDQGNAVSDPSSSTSKSAFEKPNYGAMSATDFWAQYGNGLPATIDQDDTDLMDVDLDAELDAELKASAERKAGGDGSTDLLQEAQIDEEAAEAAETARRKAELQVALQIAAEKAKAAIPWDEREDSDLEAELHDELGAPNDDPFGDITSMITDLTDFENLRINDLTVKRRSKMRWKPSAKKLAKKAAKRAAQRAFKKAAEREATKAAAKAAEKAADKAPEKAADKAPEKAAEKAPEKAAEKTAPDPTPSTTPPAPAPTAPEPVSRIERNQTPPTRRIDELPQLYHLPGTDWNVLKKHMNLSTHLTMKHCYQSLGLDAGRGGAVHQNVKAYLRIPGNSVNLSAKNADTEEAKDIIAAIAHKLLYDQRWGQTYFARPSLASGCKHITFEGNSTEVFLAFCALLYKVMKLEEKRKKGAAKQREDKEARVVSQHPTSEAFANATYLSPRAAPQLLPEQAPATATHPSTRAVTQPLPKPASATGTRNPPRAMPQPSPVRVSTTSTQNSPRAGPMHQATIAAAVARYLPPGAGLQPPPQQASAIGAHNSSPVVAQQQPKWAASAIARYGLPPADHQPSQGQAFVNGAHNPCVAPVHPAELAILRIQGKRA